jgi:hypothetical protein
MTSPPLEFRYERFSQINVGPIAQPGLRQFMVTNLFGKIVEYSVGKQTANGFS